MGSFGDYRKCTSHSHHKIGFLIANNKEPTQIYVNTLQRRGNTTGKVEFLLYQNDKYKYSSMAIIGILQRNTYRGWEN